MARRFLRIYSWNVNGLRAIYRKGFLGWLGGEQPDFLGLQEVRATRQQLGEEHLRPLKYESAFVEAERKGYSGVGAYFRGRAEAGKVSLGEEFDREGRLLSVNLGRLRIINGYFPNGNGKERDNSRVPFKLDFYAALFRNLEPSFAAGEPILLMGDLNTAHRAIDLARPKQNLKTSGFLPEECDEFDRWVRAGWVDTFRHFHEGPGHYTWWSQRKGVREKNVGWRIDYVLASPGAMPYLKSAHIHPEVLGSDHCPISVRVDRRVME